MKTSLLIGAALLAASTACSAAMAQPALDMVTTSLAPKPKAPGLDMVTASLAPRPKLPGAGLLNGVVGCDAPGAKQGVGALAGGAVGGLAGNRLMKNNKTVGTIAGAGAGAAAGSYIGCKMQVGDRNRQIQAQEAAARQAAAPPRAAPPVERIAESEDDYDAPPARRTAAHAIPARPAAPSAWSRMAKVRFDSGVIPAASFTTTTAGEYVAGRLVNVRAEPSTGARVLGSLQADDHVDVIAAIPDSPWLLVGHGTTAEGYASSTYLQRYGAAPTPTAAPARKLASGCRIVREVTGEDTGGRRFEDLKACPLGDGSWSLNKL